MTEITDDLPARLLNEEHAGWQAIIAGRGGSYFQRLMTQDALMIVNDGVYSREVVRKAFETFEPWDGYELLEPAIIRLGNRAGVVVYRAITSRDGATREFRMSTTYLYQGGGWKVAAHQQTPL
ncbi:nuclear transport factor 2 family protein [Leifsonia sp. A12D58]|uniref:nuclear transport factor 2 family protein n=1 Tax=Leifsonia sp. A12D58 TaxID=3397674 RepID=UPI0039E0D0F9